MILYLLHHCNTCWVILSRIFGKKRPWHCSKCFFFFFFAMHVGDNQWSQLKYRNWSHDRSNGKIKDDLSGIYWLKFIERFKGLLVAWQNQWRPRYIPRASDEAISQIILERGCITLLLYTYYYILYRYPVALRPEKRHFGQDIPRQNSLNCLFCLYQGPLAAFNEVKMVYGGNRRHSVYSPQRGEY